MRQYETMYVLRPDLEAEQTQELINRFKEVVASQGGEALEVTEWGKRRLAYEINEYREGYYVIMKFKDASNVTAELERLMRINESVIRYLTTRVEES
jgi:small subunit ribosomal protein S6